MTIALSRKNKLGFIDGSLSRPTGNSSGKVWDRVDNIVMGWIIRVLEDSIANSILSFKTSKEIWDELEERYGQSSNAQMFSLQEELNALTQTSKMSISDFFTKIKTLWDEFDALNPIPTCSCTAATSCTCDIAKKLFKMQQNNKVISFLMKLDKRYKQVRNNILMMPDLPSAAQAYRILLQEETHLQLSTSGGGLNETMACRAEKRKYYEKSNNKYQYTEGSKNKKPTLWCDHCKMNGHVKEKCWRIIGYPPNHKANTWKRDNKWNTNAHTASVHEETEDYVNAKFTKDQYQQILEMLSNNEPKSSTTHANTSQLTGNIDEEAKASW